jgi:L-2-hydroxyglutarate oxidase
LDLRIVPFRGTYFKLRPERRSLVNHLVYPVPDPAFPFLGVHVTRMIGGDVEAGPNAVLALAREGYRPLNMDLRDAASALLYPGLWRFLWRYPSMVGYELRRAFSRRLFCASRPRASGSLRRHVGERLRHSSKPKSAASSQCAESGSNCIARDR